MAEPTSRQEPRICTGDSFIWVVLSMLAVFPVY